MSGQAEKSPEPETGASLENAAGPPKEDESAYPHGLKLALIMGSSYLSMFLVALDRLIVTTAIPNITDPFHSVDSVGWYGSAYLLTNCAFQPLPGKLYVLYSAKTVFLVSILVFDVGSAVCGAAPNSIALIVGRAIAGCGSAGIFSGAITITVHATPLRKRPLFQGLFGAVFGLANVIAPLIGGALADSKATWRWCFYINLPIGGLSIVLIALLFHIPARASTQIVDPDEPAGQARAAGRAGRRRAAGGHCVPGAGAADLSAPTKGLVLVAYNRALRTVFVTGLAMACVAFVAALGLEWKSVKKPASKNGAGGPEAATPAADATHTSTDEDTVVAAN